MNHYSILAHMSILDHWTKSSKSSHFISLPHLIGRWNLGIHSDIGEKDIFTLQNMATLYTGELDVAVKGCSDIRVFTLHCFLKCSYQFSRRLRSCSNTVAVPAFANHQFSWNTILGDQTIKEMVVGTNC